MALDLALRQSLHAVHETVPLRHRNPELTLDRLGIKLRAVRHLDRALRTTDSHRQRVVAHHPNRGGCSRRGQRAIARRGQQQIALDHIRALEGHLLTCTSQSPELSTGLEHPGSLQLKARHLRQIAVELQHLLGLHHLVAPRHHRQGSLGIAAVQHLLLLKGQQILITQAHMSISA